MCPELRSRQLTLPIMTTGVPGQQDFRVEVAGVEMGFHIEYAVRLAVVALGASVVGCVSPADPYASGRPMQPPPPTFGGQRATTEPARKPTSPPGEVVKASASAPVAQPGPQEFTPEEAVRFALTNNPM